MASYLNEENSLFRQKLTWDRLWLCTLQSLKHISELENVSITCQIEKEYITENIMNMWNRCFFRLERIVKHINSVGNTSDMRQSLAGSSNTTSNKYLFSSFQRSIRFSCFEEACVIVTSNKYLSESLRWSICSNHLEKLSVRVVSKYLF